MKAGMCCVQQMKTVEVFHNVRRVCDGKCLKCPHPDCLVPAVQSALEKLMTGGGVVYPRIGGK